MKQFQWFDLVWMNNIPFASQAGFRIRIAGAAMVGLREFGFEKREKKLCLN
jgi:hypothetical protein